jgi:hypothetical protein
VAGMKRFLLMIAVVLLISFSFTVQAAVPIRILDSKVYHLGTGREIQRESE